MLTNSLSLATWSELMVKRFQMPWSNVTKRKPPSYPDLLHPRPLHHIPRILAGRSYHHHHFCSYNSTISEKNSDTTFQTTRWFSLFKSSPLLVFDDVDLFKSLHHHLQLSLDPSSSLVDEQSCPACVGTSLCPQVFVCLCGNLSMLEHHHRHHLSDRSIDCFCS